MVVVVVVAVVVEGCQMALRAKGQGPPQIVSIIFNLLASTCHFSLIIHCITQLLTMAIAPALPKYITGITHKQSLSLYEEQCQAMQMNMHDRFNLKKLN